MTGMSQDEADKHDLRLHRAKQLARQVEYRGVLHYIAGLHWHKGDSELTIYLQGSSEPVRPSDLTLVEPPQ